MSRRVTRASKKREEELQRKADEEYRAEKPRKRTSEELAREKFMRDAKEPEYRVPDDFGDFDDAYEDELVEEGIPDFRDEEIEDITMEGFNKLRF